MVTMATTKKTHFALELGTGLLVCNAPSPPIYDYGKINSVAISWG